MDPTWGLYQNNCSILPRTPTLTTPTAPYFPPISTRLHPKRSRIKYGGKTVYHFWHYRNGTKADECPGYLNLRVIQHFEEISVPPRWCKTSLVAKFRQVHVTENDFKLNNHLQLISSINHHNYIFIEQVISQTLVLFQKKKEKKFQIQTAQPQWKPHKDKQFRAFFMWMLLFRDWCESHQRSLWQVFTIWEERGKKTCLLSVCGSPLLLGTLSAPTEAELSILWMEVQAMMQRQKYTFGRVLADFKLVLLTHKRPNLCVFSHLKLVPSSPLVVWVVVPMWRSGLPFLGWTGSLNLFHFLLVGFPVFVSNYLDWWE